MDGKHIIGRTDMAWWSNLHTTRRRSVYACAISRWTAGAKTARPPLSGEGSLTVHTAGVKYFQHSLKKTRGVWPVMSLMLALKRSAPVGDKDLMKREGTATKSDQNLVGCSYSALKVLTIFAGAAVGEDEMKAHRKHPWHNCPLLCIIKECSPPHKTLTRQLLFQNRK